MLNLRNGQYRGLDYLAITSPASITALDITITVVKPARSPRSPAIYYRFFGGTISGGVTTGGSDILYRTLLTSRSIGSGGLDGRVWASFYGDGNANTHAVSGDSWTVDVTTTRGHSVLNGHF